MSVVVASTFGGLMALLLSHVVVNYSCSWRIGFWIGALVAVVTVIGRRTLHETKSFLSNRDKKYKENSLVTKNLHKNCFYFLLIEIGSPLFFYMSYMYFNPVLKKMGYTSEDIITHNLGVCFSVFCCHFFLMWLTLKFDALKIAEKKGYVALVLLASFPFIFEFLDAPWKIFIIQIMFMGNPTGKTPAQATFITFFPVYCRLTSTEFVYATGRAIMHVSTSIGLVFLTSHFGHHGFWFLAAPVGISFLIGINYFKKFNEKLKIEKNQKNKSKEKVYKKSCLENSSVFSVSFYELYNVIDIESKFSTELNVG
jgi:MFS family permease